MIGARACADFARVIDDRRIEDTERAIFTLYPNYPADFRNVNGSEALISFDILDDECELIVA